VILVTPSYFCNIVEEIERQGMDPRDTSLRIGIFGAEPWTGQMRLDIEQRAGIDAVDIYGLSEVMGPGVAMECVESKDGPVVWEDHFYPEIINPETGEPVAEGESGELVFTSLSKEAMPVIRYRTRDLTQLLPPTSRSMRRIGKITGRSDDMLIVRGVNLFPTQVEELVLKMPELAAQYQLVLSRNGNMDELEILVEVRAEFNHLNEAQREQLARRLTHSIKTFIGVSARVRVQSSGMVERTVTGKAKRVIDKRAF
jgi:phenylacetate-CoA ligase